MSMASRWPEIKKAFEVIKNSNKPKILAAEALKSTEPKVEKLNLQQMPAVERATSA